ncbi:hypothetical protein [Actinoplanes derwentensis]|uniref:Uncharacterized protein n=1 Tax=Actinoplanes derwentensis TaxID=113562 RepID=A0A1H1T406_9ACTN|nr:hypothetical protein [Actinoplanes derwentensis]GID89927.1 hypothetical protein Ade03nite_88510 [Actinoplanes derwentensis]SDS54914.1 hypothetical protein SAMN04489716_1029 [Actinoplanes derwentensis]
MATWIHIYYSDDPFDENPPLQGSFDYDKALRFDEASEPDSDSRCGAGTNTPELINKQSLLRTAGGRWVYEHFLQRPPNEPELTYWFEDDDYAVIWLQHAKRQNVVEHYFGKPRVRCRPVDILPRATQSTSGQVRTFWPESMPTPIPRAWAVWKFLTNC